MTSLSPQYRDSALAALAGTELDLLVIGGGVVGAGCALDATTRGLKVGLGLFKLRLFEAVGGEDHDALGHGQSPD